MRLRIKRGRIAALKNNHYDNEERITFFILFLSSGYVFDIYCYLFLRRHRQHNITRIVINPIIPPTTPAIIPLDIKVF